MQTHVGLRGVESWKDVHLLADYVLKNWCGFEDGLVVVLEKVSFVVHALVVQGSKSVQNKKEKKRVE